jgi:hypothetical protein
MLCLRIHTDISLSTPSVDHGFVTWLGVDIIERRSDEVEEAVGTARVALVHVGAIYNAEDSLYDVLDAESDELEVLHDLYFKDGWVKLDLVDGGHGADLLYVSELELKDGLTLWGTVGIQIVRRLCETLGAGCAIAVVRVEHGTPTQPWIEAGFLVTRPESPEHDGYLYVDTSLRAPDLVLGGIDEESDPRPSWAKAAKEPGELRLEFENSHGERWIASATHERFLLAGSDLSWRTIRIEQPDYRKLAQQLQNVGPPSFVGVILNREELLWLTAVLLSAPLPRYS